MADAPKPLNAKQVERLNAASTGTVIKWMSRINTWIFKASGGKLGNKFLRGAEVGILTTTGRKSPGTARCCSCRKASASSWSPRRAGGPPTRCGT